MKRFFYYFLLFMTICVTCDAQYYHPCYGGRIVGRRVTYSYVHTTRVVHVNVPQEVIVVHQNPTKVIYEDNNYDTPQPREVHINRDYEYNSRDVVNNDMWDVSVWFEEGKYVIRTDGEVNIKNVYDYLISHPRATITICGYVSLKHGTWNTNYPLAKNRVDVVKRKLSEFYGIDKNRITTSVDDFDKHPYPIDSWNQCVIIKYNK